MKSLLKLFSFVVIFSIGFEVAHADELFQSGDHCVAWKTRKRMFLVSTSTPVGKSCFPQLKTINDGKDIELQVAISSFDSGEKDRDAEVAKILGAEQQPNLIVRTTIGDQSQIEKLWVAGTKGSVPGQIVISGKTFPLVLKVESARDGEIAVNWVGKFSDFQVTVPPVAGGAVAKVYDELTLGARLQRSK